VGGNDVSSAFYCFLLANIFLVGSLVSVCVISKTDIYKYYTFSRSSLSCPESTPLLSPPSSTDSGVPCVSSILSSIRLEAVTVFIIYVVTLGCFPALTVLVEATGGRSETAGAWEAIYFVPVCCFLLYNIGDYLGRFLFGLNFLPSLPTSVALVLSLLRLVFLPLFLFCNLAPLERHLTPVMIQSDLAYCVIMMFLAVTNGFLTSSVMVAAPAKVASHEKETASNLMGGILGCGLIAGAAVSAVMVKLL